MTEEQVKELIAEMETRAVTFKMYIEKYMDSQIENKFWYGKLSETEFIIEKLKTIIE